MQINLSELSKLPLGSILEEDIKFRPVEPDEEIRFKKPVSGRAKIVELSDGVLVNFKIKTTLELLCSRCATDFFREVRFDFDQKYTFTDGGKTTIIKQGRKERFFIGKDGEVDPWPAIRQEILLSLPMKILCKKTCKGLCPICGQNLNKGKCKCKRVHKVKSL